MRYLADTVALARKDLLLELRAKETLPSMLLFVVAALTIFHFALPRGTSDVAARGLLWSALVFTALLGLTRAFVAEREQGMFDALVLAPCDRSALWLGKAISVFAFLAAVEFPGWLARLITTRVHGLADYKNLFTQMSAPGQIKVVCEIAGEG